MENNYTANVIAEIVKTVNTEVFNIEFKISHLRVEGRIKLSKGCKPAPSPAHLASVLRDIAVQINGLKKWIGVTEVKADIAPNTRAKPELIFSVEVQA